MDAPTGGPLQEISINRIKGHRKILQKRENQIVPKTPRKSPNKFTDLIKSGVKETDDTEVIEKENICSSKLPLVELVLEIPGASHSPSVEERSASTILNCGIKAQESAPVTERSFSETPNTENNSFLKEPSETRKAFSELLVTPVLQQDDGINNLAIRSKTTVLSGQEGKDNGKREVTTIDVKPDNQLPQTISVDTLKVVVVQDGVIISPNQQTPPIKILSPALPHIEGTVLLQTHDETHPSLPGLGSSTDGSDVGTIQISNNSGIKLASAKPASSLADNYLGPITDSDSSASEKSFSSSPVSSASVTNFTLIPISTSKGYSKPLDEQTLADNKPVSSGIAVTSTVFQSASSQASYCKSSQRAPLSRRNARERNRVRLVSQGFAILRQHVPQAARRKKLSKVETLRCAVDYIKALSRMIEENNANNNLVPSTSNSSTLSNSFETPNETNQTSSFPLDASQVKHERDEHRHPLHEELQRQHLQTMLPIDSSRLLNASMLSKHREQCGQIAPSRQHKDGTDFSSAPGVSSGNAMLNQRVFNLPLNEPDVLGCQFIELPCSPDLAYVPVALCASTPSGSTIQTLSQAAPPITSTAPVLRYAMPTISSIIQNVGDASYTMTHKIMTLVHSTSNPAPNVSTLTNTAPAINSENHIPSNIISTLHHSPSTVVPADTLSHAATTMSSNLHLTSPTISCTSGHPDGVLSVDSFTSSVPEVSAMMDRQEELFDEDETDDAELMDCLSWWQGTP